MAAHIIRPFKCELCEKTFKRKEALVEHRRVHLRIKCPGGLSIEEYSAISNGASVPQTASDKQPEVDEEMFACHLCGIKLPTENQLEQHLYQHEVAQEQYKCDHCDYIFFALGLLTVHMNKDHKNTNVTVCKQFLVT